MYLPDKYEYYADMILNLHTKITYGQVAPHKPILILSILDLIESGVIFSCHIPFNRLVERQFSNTWTRYVCINDSYKPKMSVAFWHMSHEPFWEIKYQDGIDVNIKEFNEKRTYNSFSQMIKFVKGAELNLELFNILTDSNARAKLRVAIIKTYL